MHARLTLAAAALLLGSAAPAPASDRPEIIKFTPGTFSAVKKGKVQGYDTATYYIDARKGQVMQVLFDTTNRDCHILGKSQAATEPVFDGATRGNEFSTTVEWTTRYSFQVRLVRDAARRGEKCRYAISFEVTG